MSDNTDDELFASAMSDAAPAEAAPESSPPPPAATPESSPPTETGEQPRTPDGRYASPTAAPPSPPEAPPDGSAPSPVPPGPESAIPPWRLSEVTQERNREREQNARLAAQLQAMQAELGRMRAAQTPPPAPPNMFDDPDAYTRNIQQGVQSTIREMEQNFSFRLARLAHGAEAFDTAFNAAMQAKAAGDVHSIRMLQESPDPGEALMRWHRQRSLIQETGGDLNAWLERKQNEWLNDPNVQAKLVEKLRGQQSAPSGSGQVRNIVNLPPSLSRAPSAGGHASEDNDVSDEALFRNAMRR